jgi:hypothetical protein
MTNHERFQAFPARGAAGDETFQVFRGLEGADVSTVSVDELTRLRSALREYLRDRNRYFAYFRAAAKV